MKRFIVLGLVMCFAVVAHAAWRETLNVGELRVDSIKSQDGGTTFVGANGAVPSAGITVALTTPGPIGSATPSSGAFTTLSASGVANVNSNLNVGGIAKIPVISTFTCTTTTLVLTSTHYGNIVMVNTNAAVALTLPANGTAAGTWIDVVVHGSASDDCAPTISAATADTLIGPNDVDLKSVTWGTGARIGAQARFWSDGSFWHVQNLGGTTLTYTD